ncbi:hypothetical protein [Flavobacterium sp.]|uniref:hypothetical protein n=1 Tax=Flavobacterium sp. TaxID=239 RepID=UPI0038D049A0
MKKVLLCIFGLLTISNTQAQGRDIVYDEISNIIVAESKPKIFTLAANYVFGTKQIQGIYTIDKHFFGFATYNYNRTTIEYTPLLGSRITEENNNNGYSFGGGYQNFGHVGKYKNLEVLTGFETQNAAVISYFTSHKDSPDRGDEYLEEKYYKIFTQFNMMKCRTNFDSGFSLKLSYFKFLKNPTYNGATNFFITPSYSFNYKLLKSKSLLLTSQIGLSFALHNFENSYQGDNFSFSQSDYVLGGILKFGIQYKFNFNKK